MNMLALTILLPLIGFVLLAFSRGRWSENLSAAVGMGSVGLAALVTAYVGVDFFANGKQAVSVPLWTWMSVGDFNIGFNLGVGRPVADHALRSYRRRLPDPHVRLPGTCAVKRIFPLLRLYQPVYRQHGGSGTGR